MRPMPIFARQLFLPALLPALLGVALLLGTPTLHAQQPQAFKAGFVNTDRIVREASAAKAAQSRLEKEFAQREKDLIDQGSALRNASDQFDRDAPTMSESQRATRQRQLVEQERDFQRRRSAFQEDLGLRKQEEMGRIFEQANEAVRKVAEAEQYDIIFQEAAYINPRLDITDKVIKALNANGGSGAR